MKKFLMFIVIVLMVVVAVPIVQYRTVNPCTMLTKELVNRARERAGEMTAQGREKAREYAGEDAERIADGIGAVIEKSAAGVVEGLAEARVEQMSLTECAQEWWRVKFRDDS
jgi:hypothetical protein